MICMRSMPHNVAQLPLSPIGQPSIEEECSPSTSGASCSIAPKTKRNPRNSAADVIFLGSSTSKLKNNKSIDELKSGDTVGNYRIQELLMSGGFGKIFLGNHCNTPKDKVALKVINPNLPSSKMAVCKELLAMRQIRANTAYHAHLVLMSDNFDFGKTSVIVMERLDCDLFDYMAKVRKWTPFEATVVVDLTKQILKANSALLDMNIVHADIKLENIMLVDRNAKTLQIKLIDYGCSVSKDHVKRLNSHTLNYRAPECILGLPTCEKADSWSLGMVVFELYTGMEVFEAVTLYQLIRQQHNVTGLPDNYWLGKKTALFIDVRQNENVYSEPSFVTPIGFVDKPGGWKQKGFENLFEYSAKGRIKRLPTADDNLICDLITGLLHKNAVQRPSTKEALLFLDDGIPTFQRMELGLF